MSFIRVLFAVLLVATAFTFFVGAGEGGDQRAFLPGFLEGLTLGKGIEAADDIVLFPILADAVPAPLAVTLARPSATVVYEEIEFPDQPYDLAVRNEGEGPVLLIGGEILVGGRLDRLVMRDFLVAPKSRVEFHTLPAEYPRDRREGPAAFTAGRAFAPEFIRERAAFTPARTLVPVFLSYLLEFRDPGDNRRSLQALAESTELNAACEACQKTMAEFPTLGGGKVVGFISSIRGRLRDLELFGTNDLLQACFAPILRAQIYAASGINARAKKAGMPLGESMSWDEPSRAALRTEAEGLLESLRSVAYRAAHMPPEAGGQTYLLKAGSAAGIAIGHEGRLLHLALYPETPLEQELFSRPMTPPDEEDLSDLAETGFGELERREARGRLTEAEKRLLDRMRERRTIDESPPLGR